MEPTIKKCVIGVELSVNRTSFAIVDVRGNILAEEFFPTNDYPNVNDYVSVLSERIIMLAEANGGYDKIRSMGVSAPSANYMTGCIENAANLPWKGIIPIGAMLRDRMGIAVAVANDAHVSALGEYSYGSAHGMKNFLLVTLGHGIGSCIFSEGKAHLGNDGFAGEVGHTCMVHNGRECGCGRRGCLESYCAEKGIIRTAKEMMAESDKPSLMRDLEELTPLTIQQCCDKGDEMAIEVYRKTGSILGVAMANYASLMDPEAIIFAGGIALSGHWLFDSMEEAFEMRVFHNLRGKVKLQCSTLSNQDRDMLGASALAWGIKEYSLFK